MTSLWGSDFELKDSKEKTKQILNKTRNPKKVQIQSSDKVLKSKNTSIEDKLFIITQEVKRILGGYEDNTVVIKSREELHDYISKSIENKIIAIDTETNNSLDPISCKLMGPCLYTPGMKNAYIPVNHINYKTGERLDWQVTEEECREEFQRLIDNEVFTIFHNGKFDYEVIHCTCNIDLPINWDTMIGAKILNELERAGLKEQYIQKIDNSIEKYSIDKLFNNIEYAVVDPEIFALYAATDPYMTYKLYEYQVNEFNKPGNEGLWNVFSTIEMPVIPVVAEMELNGICIDVEYSERLSQKYNRLLDELLIKIDKELHTYDTQIANWRLTPEANFKPKKKKATKSGELYDKSKNEQLSDPPQLTSNQQLAILLYDVLKTPVVDKKSPGGTGADILKQIDIPLCKLILEQRGLIKLINTYIDKLPNCVSGVDGRLHAHFNQIGADTGRMSSSDPNLQNIPSHNNEIRMMFTAAPGHTLVGSDFSQQEPRLLSHYSQDKNMIDAYEQDKDLYATIATSVYHNNYEDNLEFNPITNQMQPDGKHRRTSVKGLLLGLMYGRGEASIADALGVSFEEAVQIKRSFFDGFPTVEKWIMETEANAKQTGYVEDIWGRRRRLPDIKRQPYEISLEGITSSFNPLLNCEGQMSKENQDKIHNIELQLTKAKSRKEIQNIKINAAKQRIKVKDNTGFISQAERQCVNARIQGGAASMSKLAMIKLSKNQELKDLGFKLLIAVHDELIGECPIENVDRVKELLSEEMCNSAKPAVKVPMKCDAVDFPSWYYDVYSSEIIKEYKQHQNFDELCKKHCECTPEQLREIIGE